MTPTVARRSTEHTHGSRAPIADTAARFPAVPRQRPVEPQRPLALPRTAACWDGYRNAGPDVYWPAEQGDPLLS